jgi:Na+/proline symporter
LLGASVFLLQRALGAGLTIYAPAIVLSKVLGWPLNATILCSGLVVIIYTTSGGSDAVNATQKYQIGVIFAGMIAAFVLLLMKLPSDLKLSDTLAVAGGLGKLDAVDFSFDIGKRYTLWSGVLAATFHMLAYFGTDQSQVQRYISGASLRESRLGLMFNAACKIPMQFFILSIGVLLFVFYQFDRAPVYFDQVSWQQAAAGERSDAMRAVEAKFDAARAERQQQIRAWIDARHAHDAAAETVARRAAIESHDRVEAIRQEARLLVDPRGRRNDTDYVFVSFILNQFPHGVIGLLVASFFAAALSAKAAELNALGSATTVDVYRHLVRKDETDDHYLRASRWFTVFWGGVSIAFAFCLTLAENLVQAVNIVGAVFYPTLLGLFIVAFFFRRIGGTAVFFGALAAQILVIGLFFTIPDARLSYLWYNPIGCAVCLLVSTIIQLTQGPRGTGQTNG